MDTFQLGDLIIDPRQRTVTRHGLELKMAPLSFDLLVALSRGAPEPLSVTRLMDEVWPTLVVTPETVSQRVKLLRRSLNDDAKSARYIANVRARGYRVVAPVTTTAVRPVGWLSRAMSIMRRSRSRLSAALNRG